ncbi:3-isopropylmalate dehydratase large subunit [Verminephrobacter eiseniae]|uniref:3-isopropylmalate dehydratase large subunit n=1 Tax=Verminephrobacter eiseniae TaxID=364317 RepID=UPI0022375237|nr:3-isopropylmalate dehydratase large subunit [Verminephrobacter eiseniae]MCW5230195.1 3-isopropylmalate dehydratase large subunit [Verminephrobacter eiseniae]MCW5291928.1 3-isopropylmalate dehydratase large subunit [Verminephrobacter eiseniae]MCW8184919.1 3-isopropylmalate dehydratase large subunit [Verminephrobacter eiseniae]MCW8223653.1 3-isopropylmalate dehydratase large subunit [Verminephrobacter eiseniae]MCW8234701.1 3-isopropylmalate dehydratase large subunit [Verminephrobacter eisenia
MNQRTLFDKIWDEHVVDVGEDGTTLLYVDRHFLHEVTSPQAFRGLQLAGRRPWRNDANLAMPDHNVPTEDRAVHLDDALARAQIEALDRNCAEFAVPLFRLSDPRQGIVHVSGPEQGASLPGSVIVCGDSHTSTHGALATIAHGIGTSEVEHVLATQTLLARKPARMRVNFRGVAGAGVSAKDMALAMIAKVGASGAQGYAIEYAGDAVRCLSVEARMTLCNMSIEAGARCGMVAVDDKTIEYLRGRPMAPRGESWDLAVRAWRALVSDHDAQFDVEVEIDVGVLSPLVTWGTSPDMVISVDEKIPDPTAEKDGTRRAGMERALRYMGLAPGTPITDVRLDRIFIGSCTNSRLEDLRAAAEVIRGKHVAASIRQALVVPGSGLVKQQAENEGLHQLFIDAGFEWRDAGCSMCVGMNADHLLSGERCASTSNRNFEDRQGVGGRTHLVSPVMAAAAAIAGHFVDIRRLS